MFFGKLSLVPSEIAKKYTYPVLRIIFGVIKKKLIFCSMH